MLPTNKSNLLEKIRSIDLGVWNEVLKVFETVRMRELTTSFHLVLFLSSNTIWSDKHDWENKVDEHEITKKCWILYVHEIRSNFCGCYRAEPRVYIFDTAQSHNHSCHVINIANAKSLSLTTSSNMS